MIELVFFLEERSAMEMLQGVLPRLLNGPTHENILPRFVTFNGKHALEKQLIRYLRNWKTPNDVRFVVIRDQDSAKCEEVKRGLVSLCKRAGKPEALVRVACRELESWYLGDLAAVEKGLGIRGLAKLQNKNKFRYPDSQENSKQLLRELTKNRYQPLLGSRNIGKHLSLIDNRSHSFNVLVNGIRNLFVTENYPFALGEGI